MLLNPTEFDELSKEVLNLTSGGVGVDLETKGLRYHHGARAFLLGIDHEKLGKNSVWLPEVDPKSIQTLLGNKHIRYAAHNIKFEMSFFLNQFQAEILGELWCTEVMERTLYNSHFKYDLQTCAQRRQLSKHAPMLEWLKIHGPKYDEAPADLIIPYVEQDAHLSRVLMDEQLDTFRHWQRATHIPIAPVILLERATSRALFGMENRGIRVNVPYCREGLAYEQTRARETATQIQAEIRCEFVDSRKCLEPAFDRLAIPYGRTEKGNASFSAESLSGSSGHPLVQLLIQHRDAIKRASSYWENLIALSTGDARIHPSIRQAGAATLRMSIVDPAAQTWPDDPAETRFPIRRALEADPDCLIVSMDYAQMELRLMVDEAGEMGMVDAFKQGRDFHQETADQAGVPRGIAKNGRFAKLYGAGDRRIATTLGVDLEVAQRVSRAIDESSPRIAAYTDELINYARQNPFTYNWLGRRYFFDPGFEYKAPNYRIQGGCGEILRIAIVDIDNFLIANARPETRIVLPIHDELCFNWHKDDLSLIPEVKKLMIAAHRSKQHLEMDVAVHMGPNLFDLEEYAA